MSQYEDEEAFIKHEGTTAKTIKSDHVTLSIGSIEEKSFIKFEGKEDRKIDPLDSDSDSDSDEANQSEIRQYPIRPSGRNQSNTDTSDNPFTGNNLSFDPHVPEARAQEDETDIRNALFQEHDTIAVAVVSDRPNHVEEGHEDIIDGVIVTSPQPQRKVNSYLYISGFFVIALLTVILVVIFVGSSNSRDLVVETMSPSVSPTTSMAPTASYVEFLKDLFVPLSGEDVFNHPMSAHSISLTVMAKNMPMLLESNALSLNDTDGIIQRYTMSVVMLSSMGDVSVFFNQLNTNRFPHICQLYPCNENLQIIAIEKRYEFTTGKGEGTIPTEIIFLPELTHFVMPGNKLQGTIPTQLGGLKHLKVLDLDDNEFTGTIPTEIGQIDNLEVMNLRTNLLEKNVPSEIGNMTELSFVDFSQNRLTGTIPRELKNAEKLEVLSLHDNLFNGDVEFLCGNNFTSGLYSKELEFDFRTPFILVGEYGLSVDCEKMGNCSCCTCA